MNVDTILICLTVLMAAGGVVGSVHRMVAPVARKVDQLDEWRGQWASLPDDMNSATKLDRRLSRIEADVADTRDRVLHIEQKVATS